MNGVSTERFTYNANWLADMIHAFKVRFDAMGQEHPQAPDRIEEMHRTVKFIKSAIKAWFNESETKEIRENMLVFETSLTVMIELDRNATAAEAALLHVRYMTVIKLMLELAQSMYPIKR